MTDEELQNSIESGVRDESLDGKAYRRVFDALRKEPTYQLPSNFAIEVIRRMQPVQQTSTIRETVWLYAGIIAFIVAAGIAIFLTDFKINFGALTFISSYPGLIIFGALFILSLQWVDKKLVRKSV